MTDDRKHKIRLVESSLEKTARLFASNYGIKVRFDPKGRAYTDGKVIGVPAIPPDASDDVLDAMQGYICHETAHIVFSDMKALEKLAKEDRLLHYTMMFFEDIMIERKMIERFPGTAHNFRVMVGVVFNSMKEKWPEVNQYHRVLASCYLNKRHPGTNFISTFISEEDRELLKVVEEIVDRNPLESTADATEIARQVIAVLKPDPEKVLGKTDMTVSGGMIRVVGTVAEGDDDDSVPSPDAMEGEGDSSTGPTPMDTAGLNLEKLVNGGGAVVHAPAQEGIYLPFDRAHDVFQVAPDTSETTALEELRRESSDLVHGMKQRLVNSLRAVLRRRWMSGKPEGRLDRRKLSRVPLGDQNVYMTRTERPELDTAIVIAVDHSGSMGHAEIKGSKLRLAASSAIVLGDVLNALKVPFLVYGHSTVPGRTMPQDGYGFYSRWNQLWISVYSRFGDNWNQAANRLTNPPSMNNTLDGEALRWGAQQLLARPEKRKVLFWLNDGWPEPGQGNRALCQKHVHDVVAACNAAGIEVVAFGIMCDDVKHYYPNHVVIHDLKDLVREPLNKLDAILRKAAE